jgi:hypothetical protein
MGEPHAPQQPAHTWKGFVIEIATIAVGLLLALALQQTVQAIQDAHEREQIEGRIRAALETDLKIDADNFLRLRQLVAYLVELRNAVSARIEGVAALPQPLLCDPRIATFIIYPGLAPYEAAQNNGTVALLDESRIRLYNRLSFARQIMLSDRDRFIATAVALEGFQSRYTDAEGTMTSNAVTCAVDLRALSKAELIEYRTRIGDMIAATEALRARMDVVDQYVRSLLNGATTEMQLRDESVSARPHGFGVDDTPPDGAPEAGAGSPHR